VHAGKKGKTRVSRKAYKKNLRRRGREQATHIGRVENGTKRMERNAEMSVVKKERVSKKGRDAAEARYTERKKRSRINRTIHGSRLQTQRLGLEKRREREDQWVPGKLKTRLSSKGKFQTKKGAQRELRR